MHDQIEQRERRQATGLAVMLLIGALLLLFGPTRFSERSRVVMGDVAYPGLMAAFALGDFVTRGGDDAKTDHETVEALRTQRDALRAEARRLRLALLAEQERAETLRSQLGLTWTPPAVNSPIAARSVRAAVLGRSGSEVSRLLLDAGANELVSVDQAVLVSDHLIAAADGTIRADATAHIGRQVIGRVHTVGRHTCSVEKLTDADYRGHAIIVHAENDRIARRAEGILAGTGDDVCSLLHVPATVPISVGDEVYRPVQSAAELAPLFYGTITAADVPGGAQHWEIEVTPGLMPTVFRDVEILLPRPASSESATEEGQ